jgi:hypothetical protein
MGRGRRARWRPAPQTAPLPVRMQPPIDQGGASGRSGGGDCDTLPSCLCVFSSATRHPHMVPVALALDDAVLHVVPKEAADGQVH